MPAQVSLTVALEVILGPVGGTNRPVLQYNSPVAATGAQANVSMVTIPNGANNQVVNLATLFPNVAAGQVITLKDVSAYGGTPGSVKLGLDNPGNQLPISAGGAMVLTTSGALPILYFTNSSGTAVDLEIGVVA